jgi:Sec-independent protein translocase protein TatA
MILGAITYGTYFLKDFGKKFKEFRQAFKEVVSDKQEEKKENPKE